MRGHKLLDSEEDSEGGSRLNVLLERELCIGSAPVAQRPATAFECSQNSGHSDAERKAHTWKALDVNGTSS